VWGHWLWLHRRRRGNFPDQLVRTPSRRPSKGIISITNSHSFLFDGVPNGVLVYERTIATMLPLHLRNLLKDPKVNCRIVPDNARSPAESVTESTHHRRSVPLPHFPPRNHKHVSPKHTASLPQRVDSVLLPPASRWDSNPVGDVTPRTPTKPRKSPTRRKSNRGAPRPPQRPCLRRYNSDSRIRIPVRQESYDEYHTAQLLSKVLEEVEIYDDKDDMTLCTSTTETLTEDSSICSMGRRIWWNY